MPLDVPDGAACFVDANIFYYHFVETAPFSDGCSDFLEHAAKGAVAVFTSIHVLAEAMHKIMLAEAAASFGLGRTALVNWLQAHRRQIGELREFRKMVDELCSLPLTCLPLTPATLPHAAEVAQKHSLLTNDALSVALMRNHGLNHLVTNDDDFDGIPGLTVWKPR